MTRPDFSKQMSIEDARTEFPLGTRVRYFPRADRPSFVHAVVRSRPWALGHGDVVVNITGWVGGAAVNHLLRDA